MEIILLERVAKLGRLGEKVSVKPGYARNYLIPRGIAKPATLDNIKAFEEQRADLEQRALQAHADAEGVRDQLDGQTVVITAKAGAEGKLFGSVGPGDIADAISRSLRAVERKQIRMADGPLRRVGEYQVAVVLHADVEATVTVVVEAG